MANTPTRLQMLCVLAVASPAFSGCETYVAPPKPSLADLDNGLLGDPTKPLVLDFSKPIDPGSLRVHVVRLILDDRGFLADEGPDPTGPLSSLYDFAPDGTETGGSSQLSPDHLTFTVTPKVELPLGTRLAVLVDPGLSDGLGHITGVRTRIPFAYQFNVHCDAPSRVLTSGAYFLLTDVVTPIPVQIQLFAQVDVDTSTGEFIGQFTRASRSAAPIPCPAQACPSEDVCRRFPGPDGCVIPSTKAGSPDEFQDWVPNSSPPVGYSFTAIGCAVDQPDGSANLISVPVDVQLTTPSVTLLDMQLTASFAANPSDGLVATGTLAAQDVVLGGRFDEGAANGNLRGRSLPPNQAPPGIPSPPPLGTDGGL
jgi:hypothetical protein